MASGWIVPRHGTSFAEAIESLEWRQVARRPLGPSEVRIAVQATALNFFDLLAMVDRYQVRYQCPFSPCTEAAGTVLEAGPGARVRAGDEVLVVFGGDAARAELVVEDRFVFPKPKRLSFPETAALYVGYCTGYHGLVQRGLLKPGESVLVTGAAGGMGTIAVSIAKEAGARVIGTVSTQAKRQAVLDAGADDVIVLDADSKQWVKQLKAAAPNGFDMIYEVVGGDLFQACCRAMAAGGRLLVIGFACGTIGKVPANLPLVKGYSVVGVRSGAELFLNPHLMDECYQAMVKSSIHPQVELFDARDAKAAFRKLADKKAIGKLVLDWTSSKSRL